MFDLLVLDTYRDHSLKSATRDKRTQGRVLFQYQVRDDTIIKHTVSASVSCSWQGIDSLLVAYARAVKIILIYIFIITVFDCQCGSQGGDISARAFALVCPGVVPPLKTHPNEQTRVFAINGPSLWNQLLPSALY